MVLPADHNFEQVSIRFPTFQFCIESFSFDTSAHAHQFAGRRAHKFPPIKAVALTYSINHFKFSTICRNNLAQFVRNATKEQL